MYESLLQPIQLGPTRIANRIFNPPHGTTLGASDGTVTDALIAYHEARARGGVGLIILEGMTLHPTYDFEHAFLYAGSDAIVPGLQRLADRCRAHEVPVFGQLFHAGRAVRMSHDGSRPVTWSASDVPDERYRVIPVPMPTNMVWEMVDSYAAAAERLARAGLDGVEILASMGYLIAQFLNPQTNRRDDDFGGDEVRRWRFLREILRHVRQRIGSGKTLGVRITLDEKTSTGLDSDAVLRLCAQLDADGDVDYFSVIAGSSAAHDGWIHVFPPMALPPGYVASDAARLKTSVDKPVLVAGRINQPQVAERIVRETQADMVGMVRALISDPEFVNKLAAGQADQIRACVGCNQACVGHRLAHHAISCIQNPRSGREAEFASVSMAQTARRVLVIGGGPAGMQAAVTAASRGHTVTLVEKREVLGGQVRLAERLPGRAEFGGVVTNLLTELSATDVEVLLGREGDAALIEELQPDVVIVATGARPQLPQVEVEDAVLIDSWQAIAGDNRIGQRVVVADWSSDWSGLGVAQLLAENGHHVRLVTQTVAPGESIPGIVRDQWLGELHRLQVEVVTSARFFGVQGDTAFFQHTTGGEPIVCEDVDSVVTCHAPTVAEPHWRSLQGQTDTGVKVYVVGDAMTPRTVEEAILEGYRVGVQL